MDIRYQVELSGIPRRHQKHLGTELPESFFGRDIFAKFTGNIRDRVGNGEGLFLFSQTTGTGKSTTACAVALAYIVEQLKADFRIGNRTLQLVKFSNVPEYMEILRQGMDDEEAADRAAVLTDELKRIPLVILDDIAAEKISEWSRERLLTVISYRYDNCLSTIYTSNVSLQEVQVMLGTRIRSRIEGMTVPIQFSGVKDWRRKI